MTDPETNLPSKTPARVRQAAVLPPSARRKLALARAALLQERLWPRIWPLLIGLLVFAALAFFDVWHLVPGWLHAVGLAGFAAALVLCLHHAATGWRWPSREDGLARLEDNSGLNFRPLRTLSDTVAFGAGDPETEALWRRHLERQREALQGLRVKPPAADIPRADPYALRVAATAVALIGFLYAGPEWRERLGLALLPDWDRSGAQEAIVDAWITPPDYVKSAPIFLTRTTEPADAEAPVAVPQGSVLSVRASGLSRAPALRRTLADRSGETGDWRVSLAFEADDGAGYTIEMPVEASATLEVMAGRRTLARWPLVLITDTGPDAKFAKPPTPTARGQIEVSYVAADDHGLAGLAAEVTLADTEDPDLGSSVLEQTGPLMVELRLKGTAPKHAEDTLLVELSSHPWAGHEVDIRLIATDAAGQTGVSRSFRIQMPERPFSDPLARAIIEQRGALATRVDDAVSGVLTALDGLTLAPERYMPDQTLYLGLRVAYHRLTGPLDRLSVRSVYDLLWDLALRVEDGDLSLAEQRVREAQDALAEALENGATDEEIAQLTQALRDAMADFMAALGDALDRAIERGDYAALPEGANSLSSQDLEKMLGAIEDMSKSGARGAARDLLAQMQSMMDRLQLGAGPQQLTQEQAAMADALGALGNLVDEQRALMEETFRRTGRAAPPQDTDRSANELARDQAELRERLEQMLGMLEENGAPPNGDLGAAGEAMARAQDDLSADDPAGAVPNQNEALTRLQQGMSQLSEQLGQSLGPGFSIGQAGGNGRDPLGRQPGGRATDDGTVRVPDESALQRARQILDDIKRRSSDTRRPREERDYLERLVPKF